MELIPLPESIKIITTDSQPSYIFQKLRWSWICFNRCCCCCFLFLHRLAENVKLDALIRIRLKKVTWVILEKQTHKSKIKGVWNGLFFCNNNRLRHKLAHHCLSICLINYCSIDESRVATCRMERFGFEPWSGAALRCVLGQVTLISQCLSPPRYINGYRQT